MRSCGQPGCGLRAYLLNLPRNRASPVSTVHPSARDKKDAQSNSKKLTHEKSPLALILSKATERWTALFYPDETREAKMDGFRLQNLLALILGFLTLSSPWTITSLFSYGHVADIVVAAQCIIGALIIILAWLGFLGSGTLPELLKLLVGCWLLASPWLLEFWDLIALVYFNTISGALLMLAAGISLTAKASMSSSEF